MDEGQYVTNKHKKWKLCRCFCKKNYETYLKWETISVMLCEKRNLGKKKHILVNRCEICVHTYISEKNWR